MLPDSRGSSAGSPDSFLVNWLCDIGTLTGTAKLHKFGRPSRRLLVGKFGCIRGPPMAPRTSKIGRQLRQRLAIRGQIGLRISVAEDYGSL